MIIFCSFLEYCFAKTVVLSPASFHFSTCNAIFLLMLVESGTGKASKKRDVDGEFKPDVATPDSDEVLRDKSGKFVKVIDDDE